MFTSVYFYSYPLAFHYFWIRLRLGFETVNRKASDFCGFSSRMRKIVDFTAVLHAVAISDMTFRHLISPLEVCFGSHSCLLADQFSARLAMDELYLSVWSESIIGNGFWFGAT